MWNFFDHIFHPYWILQRYMQISPQHNSILSAMSRI
jgi:hypothetical protein